MIHDSDDPSASVQNEECGHCETLTDQRVTIEIRQAGTARAERRGTMKYSRGPYRVTHCLECGHEAAERISAH